jgi:hypothetical protein
MAKACHGNECSMGSDEIDVECFWVWLGVVMFEGLGIKRCLRTDSGAEHCSFTLGGEDSGTAMRSESCVLGHR